MCQHEISQPPTRPRPLKGGVFIYGMFIDSIYDSAKNVILCNNPRYLGINAIIGIIDT